jgi:phytol kinase
MKLPNAMKNVRLRALEWRIESFFVISNIWIALVITFILALGWLRLMDTLAHRGWVSGPLSRKIIHMGTGPIFVICWLLFPDQPAARCLATLIPLAITVQFFLVGIGVIKDPAAVNAMSRNGDRREILRGPLYYGLVFVALTILFWKTNAIGIVALMILCGGDGMADVVGKRFPSGRLPWSSSKTWMGSLSMFFGGWLFSAVVLLIYVAAREFTGPFVSYLWPLTIIALICTLIESMPFRDIDNLTVPAVAVLLGYLLFQ